MRLKDYLESKDLNGKGFSEISGLSEPYLSQIANGKRVPSTEAIIKIHRATNGQVTFEDLVAADELVSK